MTKITNLYYGAMSALTVALMSNSAFAQGNGIGKWATTMDTNVQDFKGLLGTVAYVAGAGMGIGGVMKLKQHVDSPNQVPMKDGLMRLAAAGMLVSLPFVIDSFSKSIGATATDLTAPDF